MPTTDAIFTSPDALRRAFEEGLAALIERDGLGPFILAAANASFEAALWERLRPALAVRFGQLREQYRRSLTEGRPVPDGEEDLAVFLKLALIGFEALQPTTFRRAGSWEVQFNPLRAFRPRRMSGRKVDCIRLPFDTRGFHFNKPFMEKEILWEGELGGVPSTLYYNKYPFVPLHGLLVPERQAEHPQYLTEQLHRFAWDTAGRLGETLPGFGLAYNAYGAGASVNHLHLQMFVAGTPLPVASPRFVHNGGSTPYPAECQRLETCAAAWEAIAGCHAAGTAYNLIYLPGHALLLPRRRQGTFTLPPWCGTCAWYEMAGGAITANLDDYESLSDRSLEGLLSTATANA